MIRGYPRKADDEWFGYKLEVVMRQVGGAGGRQGVWVASVVRKDAAPHSRMAALGALELQQQQQQAADGNQDGNTPTPPASPAAKLARSPSARDREALAAADDEEALGAGETESKAAEATTPAAAAPAEDAPILSRSQSAAARVAPLVEMGFAPAVAKFALDMYRQADGRDQYEHATAYLSDPANADIVRMVAQATEQAEKEEEEGGNGGNGGSDDDEAGGGVGGLARPKMVRTQSTWGGVASSGTATTLPVAVTAAAEQASNRVLLNLLAAPKESPLFHLASVLTRLDDLSHVLVWARRLPATGCAAAAAAAAGEDGGGLQGDDWSGDMGRIMLIELPRLKLRFQPRPAALANGTTVTRLFSLDYSGWFVADDLAFDGGRANEGAASGARFLHELLRGVPHCVVLQNAKDDLQVLVPNHEVRRPKVRGDPFGANLVFDRDSEGWKGVMASARCYLYPVHSSRAFLQTPSLDSALYLLLLRFLARDYEGAARLCDACAVDVAFSPQQRWIFGMLEHPDDAHPDARALRVRLLLSLQYSPEKVQAFWEMHEQLEAYLELLPHVSAECRLTPEEELDALCLCKRAAPHIKNRLPFLRALRAGPRAGSGELFAAVEQKGPQPRVAGRPWNMVSVLSPELKARAAEGALTQFKYERPGEAHGPHLQDEEALNLIYESEFMDDEESGVSRQLGWCFLYELLAGQLAVSVGGVDCGRSMGELLLRCFQLKLARWGKDGEAGEADAASMGAPVSWQVCVLAAVQDYPHAGWPLLVPPDDGGAAQRALAAGVNFVRAPDRCEGVMMAVDMMKIALEGVFADGGPREALVAARRAAQRAMHEPPLSGVSVVAATAASFGRAQPPTVTDMAAPPRPLRPFRTRGPARDVGGECVLEPDLELTAADVACFVGRPLDGAIDGGVMSRLTTTATAAAGAAATTMDKLQFDLGAHPVAQSLVAERLLRRMDDDCGVYARREAARQELWLESLTDRHVAELIADAEQQQQQQQQQRSANGNGGNGGNGGGKGVSARTLSRVDEATMDLDSIVAELRALQEVDRLFVENALLRARECFEDLPDDDADGALWAFRFRRLSGLVPPLGIVFGVRSLLSTAGAADLLAANPYLEDAAGLQQLLVALQLHANRITHAARAIEEARSLRETLARVRAGTADLPTLGSTLTHQAKAFVKHLTAKRYTYQEQQPAAVAAAAAAAAPAAAAAATATATAGAGAGAGAAEPKEKACDMRFLVFEFMFDLLLRSRQVEMVQSFKTRAEAGQSSCQQMIMGAGKTTVIGPLLALCLADGERLVTQVMPTSLLEFTRGIMRSAYASIVPKRIFTLEFARDCADSGADARRLFQKLDMVRRHRGIVCAAPECVKSLVLKFVEQLHVLESEHSAASATDNPDAMVDDDGPAAAAAASAATASATAAGGVSARQAREERDRMSELEEKSSMADGLVPILRMWKRGVLIMDEVGCSLVAMTSTFSCFDLLTHSLTHSLAPPLLVSRPLLYFLLTRWMCCCTRSSRSSTSRSATATRSTCSATAGSCRSSSSTPSCRRATSWRAARRARAGAARRRAARAATTSPSRPPLPATAACWDRTMTATTWAAVPPLPPPPRRRPARPPCPCCGGSRRTAPTRATRSRRSGRRRSARRASSAPTSPPPSPPRSPRGASRGACRRCRTWCCSTRTSTATRSCRTSRVGFCCGCTRTSRRRRGCALALRRSRPPRRRRRGRLRAAAARTAAVRSCRSSCTVSRRTLRRRWRWRAPQWS